MTTTKKPMKPRSPLEALPNDMLLEIMTRVAGNSVEALDRTLRDIMSIKDPQAANKHFRGITVLLGGDFRQILPVVTQGSRQDTVQASINRSYLWDNCHKCFLTENMRLKKEEKEFAKWILDVGNGDVKTTCPHGTPKDGSEEIELPNNLLVAGGRNPILSIFKETYSDNPACLTNPEFLESRAILTPRNETVDDVNTFILTKLPGEMHEYLSCDSIPQEENEHQTDDSIQADDGDEDAANPLYTTEYLNTLKCSGLPNHRLQLNINAPIILLRNINQEKDCAMAPE